MGKRSVTEPGYMHRDNPYQHSEHAAPSKGILLLGIHVIRELPSKQVIKLIEEALMEHLRDAQYIVDQRLDSDKKGWDAIDQGAVDLFKILRLARYEAHLTGGDYECRFRDYVDEENSIPELERAQLEFLMKIYPKIPRDRGLESKMMETKRYVLCRAVSAWRHVFDEASKRYFNFVCSAYEPNDGFKKRILPGEDSYDFRRRELYASQDEKNLIEDLIRKRIKTFPSDAVVLWSDEPGVPQKLRECLLIGWAKNIGPKKLREVALANK